MRKFGGGSGEGRRDGSSTDGGKGNKKVTSIILFTILSKATSDHSVSLI